MLLLWITCTEATLLGFRSSKYSRHAPSGGPDSSAASSQESTWLAAELSACVTGRLVITLYPTGYAFSQPNHLDSHRPGVAFRWRGELQRAHNRHSCRSDELQQHLYRSGWRGCLAND